MVQFCVPDSEVDVLVLRIARELHKAPKIEQMDEIKVREEGGHGNS
jgi:hypothetical protein